MELIDKFVNALIEELQDMAQEAVEGESTHVVLADLLKLFSDVRAKLNDSDTDEGTSDDDTGADNITPPAPGNDEEPLPEE